MEYDHLYAITTDKAQVVRQYTDEASHGEYVEILWDGLEPEYLEEYKQFFRAYGYISNYDADPDTLTRMVIDPVANEETIEGVYLLSSVSTSDRDEVLLRITLLRVYDTIKVVEDDVTSWPRAVLMNKGQYRSTPTGLVLQFRHIDPRVMDDLVADDLSDDSYAGIITGNDTYAGTWFNRSAPQTTVEDGSGTITWYLTRHNNDDAIYSWMRSATERIVHFFKYNMLPAGWIECRDTYYFTPDGHVYVSAAGVPGTGAYTKKDGVDADGTLPIDAALLSTVVIGRDIDGMPSRREDDRTTDLHLTLLFTISTTYDGGDDGDDGRNPLVTYGEVQEQITLQEIVISSDLPTLPDLGEIADGGRSKTVTRYDNFVIEGGKYKYRKTITEYVAPQNGDLDDWFLTGDRAGWEREVNRVQTLVTDYEGATGWEPGDTGPYIHTITIPRRRTVDETTKMKMFVRQPTTDDLTAASIDAVSRSSITSVAPAGGYSEQTDRVQKIGANLYLYLRTTVTYGDWAQDLDGDINYLMSAYNNASAY